MRKKVLWKQTMTFTCWVWHALPTGRPSIVHHSEWTLCTPLAGCGAWFSVFRPSFQLWTEAGNLGPTRCYAAMLSGWQWHNAPRCSLGALGDGPSSWVTIVGHVRTGQAWTEKKHCVEGRPLWSSLHTIILFFGFAACDFPVASEKLGKCELDSFRTYLNVFGQNLICIEWGWHFAYHLKKTVAKGWIFAMMSGMFFRKGACRCWQVVWFCHFRKKGQHAWIQWLAWMVGQVGTVVAPVHWVDSTIIWRFPTMGVPQNWCFYNGTSESD